MIFGCLKSLTKSKISAKSVVQSLGCVKFCSWIQKNNQVIAQSFLVCQSYDKGLTHPNIMGDGDKGLGGIVNVHKYHFKTVFLCQMLA